MKASHQWLALGQLSRWMQAPKSVKRQKRRPMMDLLEPRCLLTASISEFITQPGGIISVEPLGIARGSEGNIWFTELHASKIGMINPTDPNHTVNALADGMPAGASPQSITSGPNGDLYFTESGATGFGNAIGLIDPSQPITQNNPPFTGTPGHMITAGSGPFGIASSDGKLWFTQTFSGQIGVLDPNTGAIDEISSTAANPFNINGFQSTITAGPNGNLWFTEQGAIATLNPGTGSITQVTLPTPNGTQVPFAITTGPDGNIWFVESDSASSAVGVIYTATLNGVAHTEVKEFAAPAGYHLGGITAGPDNNIWVTLSSTSGSAGQIGFVNVNLTDPTQDTFGSTIPIPTQGQAGGVLAVPNPAGIVAGPDGNLWFADFAGAVGVVNLNVQPHFVVSTAPPSSVTAGAGFGFTVTAEYGSGIVDTLFNGNVTVSLVNIPSGGSTTFGGGSLTVSAVHGVATFSGLSLNKAATGYTLQASASGTNAPAPAITSGLNVVAAAATKLTLTSQPPASIGTDTGFGFAVAAEDQFGNVATTYSGTVTVTVTTDAGGAGTKLSGTRMLNISPASATPGIATFSGLSLNNLGTGYKLGVNSSPALATATTNAFDVTVPVTPPPPPPPPPVPPPPPTITGESVVVTRKLNKKHKPVGKAILTGYTITFSTAMDQGSLANRANYQVALKVIKKVKVGKKKVSKTVLQPIGFSVSTVTSNSVTLKLAGNQKFPNGGQITIIAAPPSGVDNTSHVFLAQNGILAISPKGTRITRVS